MDFLPELCIDKHVKYLYDYANERCSIEGFFVENIKVGGMYWSLTTLALICPEAIYKNLPESDGFNIYDKSLKLLSNCKNEDGGFGNSPGHESHLIPTHYAVLVCILLEKMDMIDVDKTTEFVLSLQNVDGSFNGDSSMEADTRHSYSALAILTLLKKIQKVDLELSASYILSCMNHDGGFGWTPNGESHAASAFCSVAALSLSNRLYRIDRDRLGWWLCERQTSTGGFNGRHQKLPDVCYSWWISATLYILGRQEWFNRAKLIEFILESQNTETGGISHKPGNISDVFHTFFGIATIYLIKMHSIHPVFVTLNEKLKKIITQ
ncbi:geranylgeranyl transferase type-2 subunit beta [Babesia microti strain RI]|uniref:Geranylgeranyl transferase type-2 subunit beta n=1 Tax=Babesia microti (strain RI) TaxID=1133968 RepID=I7IS58_BABMR|nr:geranylgeranyl transferase type-2 subunit beta [Babesia microti strain RI]CCF75346.1 geranylgeranyl transferase type-2 subunit beta [Babesia microti strain RI]|eukprot:XP_012649754.1 geranylgeranyl transferase type-2 subunit beta [Babesia microti strain RI]